MDIKELKNAKKVKCTNSNVRWFTKDKEYEIVDYSFDIKDDEGDYFTFHKFKSNDYTFTPIHDESQIDLEAIKESGIYVTNCKQNYPTPPHYQGTIQPIDLINAQNLNFNLGNVVKYVCRAGKKDGETTIKDLNKAIDYINFEIERLKWCIIYI